MHILFTKCVLVCATHHKYISYNKATCNVPVFSLNTTYTFIKINIFILTKPDMVMGIKYKMGQSFNIHLDKKGDKYNLLSQNT